MTIKPHPSDAQVTARLPATVKDILQKAADLTGATLDQFIVQAAVREAKEVIESEQVIRLSTEDADRIFSLMGNPPPLNDYLVESIRKHQAFFSEED